MDTYGIHAHRALLLQGRQQCEIGVHILLDTHCWELLLMVPSSVCPGVCEPNPWPQPVLFLTWARTTYLSTTMAERMECSLAPLV